MSRFGRPRYAARTPHVLPDLPTGPRLVARAAPCVLVVDNYDSFTHNVVNELEQLGARLLVKRNDAVDLNALERADDVAGVVLSPGPGRPRDAGVCVPLIRLVGARLPILGICLGHQAIAAAYGGAIVRSKRPLHGQASTIHNERRKEQRGLLHRLPATFEAARYHSLVVDPKRVGRGLEITCRSDEGEVMGLAHRTHPVEGIQFHPESYLTAKGPWILAAFLTRAGLRPRSAAKVVR